MNLHEYAALDGLGLAELVRERQVSPGELAAAALGAIERANGEINAVIEVYDTALHDAEAAADGPFRGVPFFVKDVGLHFKGLKTEFCSRLCRGMVASEDSNYARLVKGSGVTIVGRTNTPEFSMSTSSENLLYGATSTPWKKGHSANGSTGGGAAAVAAGMVPIAHGSDIGGSIRGPAAWCGGVGLKPSRGRISSGPSYDEWGHGMAMSFVQTKTLRDTAAMLDCLADPQPGDPFVIAGPSASYRSFLEGGQTPHRIAFWCEPLIDAPVDPEVAAAVCATAETLSGLGHEVSEAAPPIDLAALDRACLDAWFFGFDRRLDDYARRMGRTVGPDTVEAATLRFYDYAKGMSHTRFFDALAAFNAARRAVGPFFADYDAWVTPTMVQVAPEHGTYNMNVDLEPEEFIAHEERPAQFMVLYNVTGQPAISLPLAMHTSGLPIGVQIAARPAEEHVLIRLGAALEEAMPWRGRVPPLHVSKVA